MSEATTLDGAGGVSRADARRNRAKVLLAAQRAFAQEGLSVTLGEIARRAGVGAGTVYRHFPSKEDLLEAVLSQRIAWLTRLATEHSDSDDPGAGFFTFIDEVLSSTIGNRDLCELFESQGDWPRAVLLTSGRRFSEALGRLLAAAQRQGAVRGDVDSTDVQELFTGWVAMRRYRGEAGGESRTIAMMVDLLRPDAPSVTKTSGSAEIRDEKAPVGPKRNAPAVSEARCPMCSRPVGSTRAGRPAQYCGSACRQKAYRQRARSTA